MFAQMIYITTAYQQNKKRKNLNRNDVVLSFYDFLLLFIIRGEGKRQADRLAGFLNTHKDYKVKKLYASDLVRSVETAITISKVLGIPVIQMSEFREANNGDLAGMDNKKALELYSVLTAATLSTIVKKEFLYGIY